MTLLVTKVPRALETQTKLLGFELGDLLIIFLYLAVSNLVFGATAARIPLVWGVSIGLAIILYVTKKNKPERYIEHTMQALFSPGVYYAGGADIDFVPLPKMTEVRK